MDLGWRRSEFESRSKGLRLSSAYNRLMTSPQGIRPTLRGNVDEALRLFAMEAECVGLNVDETEYVLEEALKCYGSVADASHVRSLFAFYPNTGSGRTFWRAHLITGERVEFWCTQMKVRPDPLIFGKEFADVCGRPDPKRVRLPLIMGSDPINRV